MVASIDIFTNDVTDMNLAGVAPAVQFENLAVLRRHDPDDAANGLLLYLVLLDPTSIVNIIAGELEADIMNRQGGRPNSGSSIMLNERNPTVETTVGRLLNSQSQSEFSQAGNAAAFAGAINDPWPTGLSLNTRINTALSQTIRLNSQAATWEKWGGLYGQDFSDIYDVGFKWTPG